MRSLRRSLTRRMRAIMRSPSGAAGVILVTALIALAVVAPPIWGDQAARIDAGRILQGRTPGHPLGTDGVGRDLLARLLVATRPSLVLALLATLIGVLVGVPLGALPVLLRGRVGRLLASTVNTLVAFPGLLLAMFTSVVLGLGARGAVIGVGIATAPVLARLTLTLTSSVAGSDYVAAARVLGVSRGRILTRHILPNVAEPLILNITMIMGSALLGLAGLSFLGLGTQPPDYDWGRLLSEGLGRVYVDPEVALGPAVAVMIAGMAFNLLGERLARLAAREAPSAGAALAALPAEPVTRAKGTESTDSTQGIDGMQGTKSTKSAESIEGAQGTESIEGKEGTKGTEGTESTESTERADRVADQTPEGSGAVLEVDGLSVTFPGVGSPVRGVSLRLNAGEIVGVVGESGSGKSLTAQAIGGLVPYPGTVRTTRLRLDGHDLETLGRAERRRLLGTRLAMVFQDPMASLNPALRVGAQLAEVPRVHAGLSRTAARRRAVELLGRVRIPDPRRRARQRPHEFSGGMRQRATIAMGLMGGTRLLIADEPTTALDVTVQRQILDLIGEVSADTGAAVLFISHDVAVVAQICHRVVVMYAGRVVEELPVADLVSGPAHPYTRALLAALPDLATDRDRPLATIPGRPPAPGEPSPGCAFAPRCAHATETCHQQRPPLRNLPGGRRLACWHPGNGPVRPERVQEREGDR